MTASTKIQFMSDLHLERFHHEYTTVPSARTVILGGDIGRFLDYEELRGFLSKTCQNFEHVLLVPGNHEFYGGSREEGLEAATRLENEPSMSGKLQILHRKRFNIPESSVTIMGCTLHSHIAPDYTALTNDFQRIRSWRVNNHNAEHWEDFDWLSRSLQQIQQEEPDRKVVVVTHYAPAFKRVSYPQHEGSALSQCFCSDTIPRLKKAGLMDGVSHWIFGHTH